MGFTPSYELLERAHFYIAIWSSQVMPLLDCLSSNALIKVGIVLDLLIHWFISAASLMIVAFLFPGIQLQGFGTALIAPIVIGFINATLGLVFKLFTLPLTVLTLGLFWLVINALMLQLAAALVPGFFIAGFWSAFFGAIVLSVVSSILSLLIP
jgi:putative membrane protein